MTNNLYYSKYFTADVLQSLVGAHFANKEIASHEVAKKFDPVTLHTDEGLLNQPNAILRYLCSGTGLQGKTNIEKRQISQWFEHFNIELFPLLREINEQIFGEKQKNEKKFQYCIIQLKKQLQLLNNHLKLKSFFVGDSITCIDICFASQLENVFRVFINEQTRKKYQNLTRWFVFVRGTGPFLKYYGKVILCGKNILNIFEKQPIDKSMETKTSKKEHNEDHHEEVKKPKHSQTIEKQEVGGFKIDDFKRSFQNSQNREEVVKELFTNFDSSKWSIWKIHYQKDVTEGKVNFLTMNMASGSLQRLDSLRKIGFGTWGVYGVEGEYEIRGVMFWKGTQIAEQWKQHPSYSFHTFTKLNHQSVDDQKIILDYWLNRQSAQGLPLYDSKRLI